MPTRKEIKALQGRRRFAEFKQRVKDASKHRGDQVRFYQVPMLDSEVNKLILELRIDCDQSISDQEWDKLVGRVIAAAARLAIKNCR